MVTIIIMEAFINKMRRLKGIRKMILIEEAWKAIASANMADYIKYLYKTVRKYSGKPNCRNAGGGRYHSVAYSQGKYY